MSKSIRNPSDGIMDELAAMRKEINVLKGTPTQSGFVQRFQAVRTKAGTPSDADYTAVTMPPIGAIVIDVGEQDLGAHRRRDVAGGGRCLAHTLGHVIDIRCHMT